MERSTWENQLFLWVFSIAMLVIVLTIPDKYVCLTHWHEPLTVQRTCLLFIADSALMKDLSDRCSALDIQQWQR